MDGNTVSTTCRTFRAKLLSVLLAVLMLFTSIPAMFPASASGSGGSGNPIVLTNASVEFKDKNYGPLSEVDSGEIFYLMATIAGNNVEEGEVDSYRIEISDKNLLLPNFAGNGFKDGAVYNGYTLHVNSDGSRYITFNIDNGQTKQVRLQAKFQNGKTANGTKVEVKLTQESSGKSVSNQITADAAMQWSASKGENRTSLKAQEIAKGTTVNYTLSASPNNASKKTGAEWVQSLKFEDTISLENMTFLGDAKAAIQSAVKAAIQAAGYDAEPTVTVNDGKADISFVLNSRNENAEMPAVNLNVALPLNSSTVKMNGTADGKVTNSLTVSGKPYGDDASYSTIGGNSVELKVSAPQGPKFSLSKTVENEKAYYVKGDKVKFVITVTNSGDADGTISLNDALPDGLTATGETAWNDITVPAGQSVTKEIVCTVDKDETVALKNTVTGSHGEKAEKTIQVKKDEAVIEAPKKDGYVTYNGKDLGQRYYPHIAGQIATYTISVTNSGAKDADNVTVSDANLSQYLENMTCIVDGKTVAEFPSTISVPAEKTVQITVTGTIKGDVDGEILNVATVDDKPSNKVKFTPDTPKAQLGITKTVDTSSYVAGDILTYTIVIENNGTAAANGVTFSDAVPDALENVKASTKQVGYAITTTKNAVESSGDWKFAPGKKVTITITGTVKTGTTGEIVNRAQCGYNGDTINSNEVKTTKDTSGDYKAEKWIVDASGNVLVDASSDPASDFKGFSLGDTVTYRARFTNNSGDIVDKVGLYDYAVGFNLLDNGTIRIYDGETGTLLKTVPRQSGVYSEYGDGKNPLDWSKGWLYDNTGNNAGHYPKMRYLYENANLENGKSLIFEYDMVLSRYETVHAGQQISGNLSNENDVYFKANGLAGDSSNGSYDVKTAVKPKLDVAFETVKFVDGSEAMNGSKDDYAIEDAAKLSDDVFFKIELRVNPLDTADYTDAVFTIKDKLPDGMHWDSSYTTSTWGWENALKLSNLTLVSKPVEENGVLTFQVKPTVGGGGKLSYGTSIVYAAKFTDEKIAAMQGVKKSVVTNTVTEITVTKDGDTLHEIKPNAQATVTFAQKVPAPGFAKLAVASYAGKDYTNADLQKVENGYITAGDTLIWQAVLYNGKGETTSGKATLNGEELGKLDLTDVTLTDNLPGCYEFDNTSYPTKYFVVPLKADGSFDVDQYGMVTGTGHAIQTAVNGDSVSWDVSGVTGTGVTEGKLEPNYAIVVQFATTVKDGQEKEGVITNTGYATIDQPFTAEDTVAGEKRDTQIWNYANYNIVGLTTESWKTITYTNQNHTGTPHTDPATDTGYSREPTHNYVQGMQGEDVTYELHIKNNSPVDLENMTIIDRLPYVGDLGLVSGYARNSAFGVTLKSIDSVMVDETDATANAAYSYSTDKTSVLNEYSKDWLGQNDVMNWTNIKSDDTVNFRIQLQDTTVKVGDEVVVKVTATVPSYVAKTGEANIAWNSFAYSYQNPDILGDTVMVAEPAKVGVWVQTPDTTVDVTVNKTLKAAETKDATFYFALFTDENYTTRLSDVISVTIPAGQTAASVTMKDVDLSSIKQQTNNANNVYLLETDAKGNQIHNYTPTYTGNEISTDATTDQTVGVINTKNTGEITLTKTLAGENVTGDTFYFALFTKNAAGDYVRYEEAPVQSLTFTEAGPQDVIFENVPKGVDFYVLETNANGVLADTDFGSYTSDSGIRYTSAPAAPAAVQAGGKTEITNTEEIDYSITVSKVLIADDVKSTPVFSVGLFTKNGNDYTPVDTTKNVTAGSDLTFDGLKADTPYYIFEMDGDKRVENGASFQMPVVLDPKNSTTKTDTTFYVSYDCCDKDGKVAALTLTKDAPNASTIITNSTDNPTKITVTKIATEDGNPAVDHAIDVGLFTQDTNGNYQQVEKKAITIAASDNGKKSVTFDGLDSSKTYYVFEMNGETMIPDGGTTKVSNKTFVASYSGGNMVAMDVGIPGAKTITDTYNQDVKLSFAKTDVDGKAMTGYKLTLTKPDGNEESWTTDGTAKVFTNLAAGKYTLTEAAQNNYVPVDVTFEIGDDGYIVTENAESMAYAVLEKTGVTVINRAQVSVDKQDIANSEELAGAVIKITRTDGGLNESVLEVKRGDTALTKETSLDESDYSKYTFSKNELTFISDGKAKTDIIGLPDGDYTMEEVAAPDGYNKVKTTFTFTIDKGQVTQTSAVSEEYGVSGNDIVMKDSAKKTISISKQAVGGGDELTGAKLKLTAPDGVDLSQIEAAYGDQSTDGIDKSDNTISWKSDGTKGSIELTNLPAGTYTLEEITAPDGFTKKAESMTFTINAEGKVDAVNGLEKPNDMTVVMKDAPSTVSIVKVGKDGDASQELPGAKMKLTYAGDADLSQVTEEHDAITGNVPGSKEITWTSGDQAIVLKQIPDGKYTLQETQAPNGYELTTEITFEVKDGVVQKDSIQLNGSTTNSYDETANLFTMFDALKPGVTISKQSING
ncbi:SpaA isopeptide-forming pilin-related protein, partial [uncultured Ruminococcus sp.]|uniref:SpaA isopeptide-forming pilin-related protein n=1 Tax=uncultured Ruminococcus sp. TaxID=165186 RepID=UPI0026080E82